MLHLAALIGIPTPIHSPDTYVDTNIKGTLNILQAARELEVERVIHTSTSEVYGTLALFRSLKSIPCKGSLPTQPRRLELTNSHFPFMIPFKRRSV